jgi:hypothetical protein
MLKITYLVFFSGAAVMLAELAVEAGLPNGVLNIVHGTNVRLSKIFIIVCSSTNTSLEHQYKLWIFTFNQSFFFNWICYN